MEEGRLEVSKRAESKYKIGKVKQIPTVQRDAKSGLTFIELKATTEENVYGCTRFAGHYREEKKLGQGTFGEVYKGVHLETQRQVAMKRIIVNVEKDLFPITAQREITILRRLDHKNIIKLIEMVYDYPPTASHNSSHVSEHQQTSGSAPLTKSFYMILPYMVSDLSGILHNPRMNLTLGDVKNLMLQLLESINYIHCEKFMHRDIKTANILIDHNGILKLADFGLARQYYGSPPNLQYPGGAGSGAKYTSVVVTRWYRAPELVLGDKLYTTAVDIWGVGCVFAECFEKKPILQGSTDIDQGHVIFKLLGTPTEDDWPLAKHLPGAELTRTEHSGNLRDRFSKYLDDTGLDFLRKLLALDPYKRLTAMSAMRHQFFKEEPLPSTKLDLPCEESHEADIKRYKEEMQQAMSQKAPTAPRGHTTESKSSLLPKENLPKAPARNIFPKGPAQKPVTSGDSRGGTENGAFQRQVSRYNSSSTSSLNVKQPYIHNHYRYAEMNRFNADDASESGMATRFPTGPQPSRFQQDDKRPTAPAAFKGHHPKEGGHYERLKFSSNPEEVTQRNLGRHETSKFPDFPRQPRSDARTTYQRSTTPHSISWAQNQSSSKVQLQGLDSSSTQNPAQAQDSRHNKQSSRGGNDADKTKETIETGDIADLY